jgi:chorismate dehydratase
LHSEKQLPRVAASAYLNSAPLIWSFLHGARRNQVDLIDAVPARCASLIAENQVDVALVPVIECQRIPELLVVPDVCVGSAGEVRSVVLASRRDDLHEIRSIALDESSRTSATLLKIVFREFVGHEPSWSSQSPDLDRMLNNNDAALIIGDPAMKFPRVGLQVWDLASLWRQFTGFGFVFAMWVVRESARAQVCDIDFRGACKEGVGQLEEIARQYESMLGLSSAELLHYLRENISFHIDESMRSGLQLYFNLANRHQLIPSVKPLKTFEP